MTTVEHEFQKYADYHIKTTIQTALMVNKELYNHPLLKGKLKFENEKDDFERAYNTCVSFIYTSSEEQVKEFYNICWDSFKNDLSEGKVLPKHIE